ncbi:MAG: hypothetical protein ABIP79_12400, partial [Chitinophagaceae bacterium]
NFSYTISIFKEITMPDSRKKFLRQITNGLLIAGLPSLTSAKEKQTENKKINIDAADSTGEGTPTMKNSGNAFLENITTHQQIKPISKTGIMACSPNPDCRPFKKI